MPEIMPGRATARIAGDFVVFLIGMRINRFWKAGKWWPVARAMARMLRELQNAPPDTGFLGYTRLGRATIVQYWRSFDHLEHYAHCHDRLHWPAWVEFNQRMKDGRGDVGIWHETYRVRAGEYEAIYSAMPGHGLAKAAERALVTGDQDTARNRFGL
jgi:hypothetical protein